MGGNCAIYLITLVLQHSFGHCHMENQIFFQRYCFDLTFIKDREGPLCSLENRFRASALQGTLCIRKGIVWNRQCLEPAGLLHQQA